MKKWVLALCLCLLLGAQAALAQSITYVFPYEGFRYTQSEGETVLTQTNLAEHAALLESLGTTSEAVLASYAASGIVMEVIPDEGGQISVSVVDAGEFAGEKSMNELTQQERERFAAQFEESGLYESCELVDSEPVCVRLISSAMYASMPVYTLRYATLHLGRVYMLSETIVGRAPEAKDDESIARVLGGVRLLSSITEPTPAPTATPTPTPAPTPVPTPGIAEVHNTLGEIQLNDVPAYTNNAVISLSGTAEASDTLVVLLAGKELGSTKTRKDGTFSMSVTLPEAGSHVLTLSTKNAQATVSLVYEIPRAKLVIDEPVEMVFTGSTVTFRGVTEPGAKVTVEGPDGRAVVDTNKNGAFTARNSMNAFGTGVFTVTARAKGFEDATQTFVMTREMTSREFLNDFRQKMINLDYDSLVAAPENFQDKKFNVRGRIELFADYDGDPCALVCIRNVTTGVWKDPMWIILKREGEDIAEGDIVTFYVTGEGQTLPADGEYTRSGEAIEAPVVREALRSQK